MAVYTHIHRSYVRWFPSYIRSSAPSANLFSDVHRIMGHTAYVETWDLVVLASPSRGSNVLVDARSAREGLYFFVCLLGALDSILYRGGGAP